MSATDPVPAQSVAFTFVSDLEEQPFTYSTVWSEVQRIASAFLNSGLSVGERVMIGLPHSPEYAFAFFGANLAVLTTDLRDT